MNLKSLWLLLLCVGAFAADNGDTSHTSAERSPHFPLRLRVSSTHGEDLFLFQTKGVTVQIPYDKINVLEYGQRVSRRYAEAVLLSPVFLLSKTRKHYLTVEFTDDRGKQQAMVFLVSKNDVRSLLVILEAKSGRRIEYQDDDARRSGKGS